MHQGRRKSRVTTLIYPCLTARGLTGYHHTPDALTGAPVAALPGSLSPGSVRGSGTMFTRISAPRSHLTGALCAASSGLLFPSQPLAENEHNTPRASCQATTCTISSVSGTGCLSKKFSLCSFTVLNRPYNKNPPPEGGGKNVRFYWSAISIQGLAGSVYPSLLMVISPVTHGVRVKVITVEELFR